MENEKMLNMGRIGAMQFWGNLATAKRGPDSPQAKKMKRLFKFWQNPKNREKYTCKLFESLEKFL